MTYKEFLGYIPSIMRVVRMMLVFFLIFDYPFAAKCLMVMLLCEMAVGRNDYGKIRAGIMNILIIYLNLADGLSYFKVNICLWIVVIVAFIEGVLHVKKRIPSIDRFKLKNPVRTTMIAMVLVAVLALGLAIVPYASVPAVSDTYKQNFDVEQFYSDDISCDRATVIDDNGEALAQRIMLIENAQSEIVMSTFSFKSDTAGKQMMASLYEAAKRGVRVRILLDGFNSLLDVEGNPYYMALASHKNVEIKIYNELSLLASWKGMSRMHDKYIVADDEVYILGGRNTFNYFLGDQKGYKNHDRDVLVYNTGGVESSVYELKEYFENIWQLEMCESWNEYIISGVLPSVEAAENDLQEVYKDMKEIHWDWFEKPDYEIMTVETDKITLLSNPTDLYMKEPWVFYGLSRLMEQAKEEVVIHTPYIVADDYMLETFTQICEEVEVKIMTNAPSNNGNLFGAIDYILNKQKILDAGLYVLEYDGGASYHAKSVTIDDEIAIVGSFNMDYKSMYHDTELMVVIDSPEFNRLLKESHQSYEEHSKEACIRENEVDMILQGKKLKSRLQGRLIEKVDPYVRFLF